MKRLLAVFTVGILAFSAHSQNVKRTETRAGKTSTAYMDRNGAQQPGATAQAASLRNAKVTTITPFYTDTFSSTSLSTGGWVAGGNTPAAGTWKFTRSASTGPFGLNKINSTTSAGGWMLYDSDSIGFLFNSAPQVGTLTSPVINCVSHPYVGVRFQQYTRRFQDTFLLQVSNNGGASWSSYPISPNMGLGTNDFTENSELTTINVTAVAGSQANVKVRFYYSGTFVGGGYNWMIDDFQMVQLDPVDVGIHHSGVIMSLNGAGFTPAGTRPRVFADTVFPLTEVSNIGGTGVTANTVGASIYSGATSVYSKVFQFPSIPINAYDSLADFTVDAGCLPISNGPYVVAFNNSASLDANPGNDRDTAYFNISDSSLCTFSGYRESDKTLNPNFYRGGYYLHAPSGAGRPNGTSYYMGTFFDIPAGTAKDTITSISVCLTPTTAPGSQIQAEVYKLDPVTPVFNSVGRTFIKTLGVGDISTTNGLVFTTLEMNIGTAQNFAVIGSGIYVAVLRPVSPSATQNTIVAAARVSAPASIAGSYGISDTSNGLAYNFGNDIANNVNLTTFDDVPAVVVNFGDASKLALGVARINGLSIGSAFPNPANSTLNIPVAATMSMTVSIGLFDMMGQAIQLKDLGLIPAGQGKTAVFSTGDLAPGVYFYTVAANDQRITKRIIVAH